MPLHERVGLAALRALAAGVSWLPLRLTLWVGRRLGELAAVACYPRTRLAIEQLTAALGGTLSDREPRVLVWRMFRHFGEGVIEFLRFPAMAATGALNARVSVEGEAHLKEAMAQGRGVLILTAHYGNFEWLAAWAASRGYPVNMVTRPLRKRVLERFLVEQRNRLGVRVVTKEQSVRAVIAKLQRNEVVGYVLDQNMGSGEGVFVEFFGRPACTISALAVLAKRYRSPVVPAFITRDRDDPTRHRIVFEAPLPFEAPDAASGRLDDITHNTQRYTAVIERWIRERPDQWIWIHRRWKTRPPGGAGFRQAEPGGSSALGGAKGGAIHSMRGSV